MEPFVRMPRGLRPLTIAGIVLVCFGAFVLLSGMSFTSRRNVLDVADLTITADEQRPVPPWVGGAAVVVGVVLIVAGARKRA
jgi:hypothetical protein